MLNEHKDDRRLLHRSKPTKANAEVAVQPSSPCPIHGSMSCSTPMMRHIEAISRYALRVRGVRPTYISKLKRFKATVPPKSLCYTAYMQVLDRLIEYAEKLNRIGGTVQNIPEHNDSRHDGEK